MNNDSHRPSAALDLAVDALLAAPPAGGLVLVVGGTASGKSKIAAALTDEVAKRSGMPAIALSEAMFPTRLFAANKINAVVLWDEIRNGATFLSFLASSSHRFTVGVLHAEHCLRAIHKLLWTVEQQLDEREWPATKDALRARLVAVIETERWEDPTITTPVPWPYD